MEETGARREVSSMAIMTRIETMGRLILAIIVACLASGAALSAEEARPVNPADLAAAKIFAPTAIKELKPLVGQKIIIKGKVIALGGNKAGSIQYLNFTSNFQDSVSLVLFANAGGGTFTKEKLGEYVGKVVRANGVLAEYNGSLQIKIESLDQLRIQPGQEQ